MSIKNIALVALTFILIAACGPTPQEIAKNKFEKAQQLHLNKEFNEAKTLLDTIIEEFPKEIEYTTRAKDLLRTINISEQKRNLTYLDSMLLVKETELKIYMKNFISSVDYGPKEILIHKRQKPQNSYNRTFLRAHLNREGDFYISSRYMGENHIHHHKIKVYHKKESATSETVPKDGFDNRHFEDGDAKWEVVNYKAGKDNGIIDFIAANANKPLKVQFIGKKNFYILMEKFDKEAIKDGYEISFILKEVHKLKEEIKRTKKELSRLQ